MTRLAYFPVVEDEEQLVDLLSRAGWYLTFSSIERIFVFVADPKLADADWRVAPGMDPAIAERFDTLRALIEFVPASGETDLAPVLEQVSMVLRWKKSAGPQWLPAATLTNWLSDKRVFDVDPAAVRKEGSFYIDVGFSFLLKDKANVVAANQARFNALAESLGPRDRAYVLATGPSVGTYSQFDYEGAVSIVCNSVILDEELMTAVKPEFLVFADPIFHFGPSQYAASFRASVRRAAAKFDFTICIPLKYYAVFTAAVPELADRTIAIPFRKDRDFNFDLTSDFELKTTANVLTFVMLPLASTFADRVRILGCDGRPLNENTYFWKHNQAVQINEKMTNIREVHPAFFDIDYNDYYLEHCGILETQLEAGERRGWRFDCMGFSHIPALRERMPDGHGGRQAVSGKPAVAQSIVEDYEPVPRLLVIDSTRTGGPSATGQIKKNLLVGWPDDAFLQICAPKGDGYTLAGSVVDPSNDLVVAGEEAVYEEVAAFQPEVIYYRPTIDLHPRLHALASNILAHHRVPVVTHLMDDWPNRLAAHDGARAREVDQNLRQLLGQSHRVLSISDKMSATLGERYGVTFEAVANGIDPDLYRDVSTSARPRKTRRKELVLRYCGALARDMTFETVVDVARAVDALDDELPLRFEVYTGLVWRTPFEEAVAGLRGVTVLQRVPDEEYPSLLAEADVLVLGYNFDEDSLRYIGLSMPNKLPEYLGSGAAVLAVGPREAAGIDYVLSRQLACCVTKRHPEELADALRRLATDPDYRNGLGAKAQAWAFEHLDIGRISRRFQTILGEAAEEGGGSLLLGPYSRTQRASIDEGAAMARLLTGKGPDGVLVDVGAHQGSSLEPFAKAGWTVVACEPDATNREELTNRFGNSGNITIDPRAVSEEPAKGAPFFSSEESTGISSLHAFRETHQKTDTVEVTTIAQLIETYGLSQIDFLKIDVEGFDWNVLKGVPWNRIKPDGIACEFEDAKTIRLDHTYRDIADFLVERGYVVYLSEWHPIIRYGVAHDWRQLSRYPAPLASADAWGNIVAFRQDPGVNRVRAAFAACLEVENPSATAAVDGEPASEDAPSSAARHDEIAAARQDPPSRPQFDEEADPGSVRGDVPPPPSRPSWIRRLGGLATRGGKDDIPAMSAPLSRYDRVYVWANARSPLIFSAGRLVMWCARKLRRYPGWTIAYLALLASLIVAGFWSAVDPYGPLFWVAAGLVGLAGVVAVSTGYAGFLIKYSDQESRLRDGSTRERLDRATISLRSEQQTIKDALRARIDELQSEQEATKESLAGAARIRNRLESEQQAIKDALTRIGEKRTEELTSIRELGAEQRAARDALDATISELMSEQKATSEALTEFGEMRANEAFGRIGELKEALEARIGELQSEQEATKESLAGAARIRKRLESEQQAIKDGLEARIGELQSEQEATKESLAGAARIRNRLESEQQAIKDALAKLPSDQKAMNEALEARIGELQSEQEATKESLAGAARIRKRLESEQQAIKDALRARIGELRSEQQATQGVLAKLGEKRTEEELARIRELESAQKATKEALESTIAELMSEQKAIGDALAKLGAERRAGEAAGKISELRPEHKATKGRTRGQGR
jgi:FkbM family methyltransferase